MRVIFLFSSKIWLTEIFFFGAVVIQVYNDEHTKFVDERNKNLAMQREFEQLRKNLDDAVEDNKNLRAKLLKDVGELRTENTNL